MTKLKRVLIMGGGTGGHVFPGLAIAAYFTEKGIDVHWLGTRKGLEARLVPEAGVPIHYLSISGVRGKSFKQKLLAPFRILYAMIQAMRVIHRLNPDIVIGMGGFVSGPGGVACYLMRKKLIIHEQNAKPGLTNHYLSLVAKKVFEGFPGTFQDKKSNKIVAIGNPVRKEMTAFRSPSDRLSKREPPCHLLVLGGSQGAKTINKVLPRALAQLKESMRPLVWHQTGEAHFAETVKAYADLNVLGEVVPFIHAMDEAYAWADMVLCRSGALTVAELCTVGLGAILVPYPYAVDDHQTENAYFMVKQNAAVLVQENSLTDHALATLIQKLCSLPEERMAMAEAAYRLRQVNVTQKILTICEEVCH